MERAIDISRRKNLNPWVAKSIVRLEAAPKLNTQIGPMFNLWLRQNFDLKPVEELGLLMDSLGQ